MKMSFTDSIQAAKKAVLPRITIPPETAVPTGPPAVVPAAIAFAPIAFTAVIVTPAQAAILDLKKDKYKKNKLDWDY